MIKGYRLKQKRLSSHVIFWYLAKDLAMYFGIMFLFMFAIFLVNQFLLSAEELLAQRVPIRYVIELMIYSLPSVVATATPFATLIGFLMCLGRFVSDNEILVLRSSGFRYSKIVTPVILMALLISLMSFFVNDYLLPLGTLKYQELYRKLMFADPSIQLESNSIKRTKDATLVIGSVNDSSVSDLILFDQGNAGTDRIVLAKKSDIISSEDPAVLMQLNMNSPIVLSFNHAQRNNYDTMKSESAIMNIFESSIDAFSTFLSPREMTYVDLKQEIKNMVEVGDASEHYVNIYKMELYKKLSIPFGALFFALFAFPVALLFGKNHGQTICLAIGVIVSVIYWAMMIYGQTLVVQNGEHSFALVWLPNFFIGIVGIFMYLRVKRK